jgi:hypothetical protein
VHGANAEAAAKGPAIRREHLGLVSLIGSILPRLLPGLVFPIVLLCGHGSLTRTPVRYVFLLGVRSDAIVAENCRLSTDSRLTGAGT